MSEETLYKAGNFLNQYGYEIDLKDDFWMEEFIWNDHKTRDIIQLMEEYAQLKIDEYKNQQKENNK